MIDNVTPSTGWLIVQRELTGSVRVADASDIWITVVFSTPSRTIAGANAALAANASLVEAVRKVLQAEGIRASVDEVVRRTGPRMCLPTSRATLPAASR